MYNESIGASVSVPSSITPFMLSVFKTCSFLYKLFSLPETNSTLLFATGLKAVKLNATKKEIIGDPHALIQQYQVEIAQLRAQLQEKEVPKDGSRRLSRREEVSFQSYLLCYHGVDGCFLFP